MRIDESSVKQFDTWAKDANISILHSLSAYGIEIGISSKVMALHVCLEDVDCWLII